MHTHASYRLRSCSFAYERHFVNYYYFAYGRALDKLRLVGYIDIASWLYGLPGLISDLMVKIIFLFPCVLV